MEKRRPTYDLASLKVSLGDPDTMAISTTARRDALELGYSLTQVASVVRSIETKHFYKSMTTYADPRVWQDVYHVPDGELLLYVNFQADTVAEFRMVSFKEL